MSPEPFLTVGVIYDIDFAAMALAEHLGLLDDNEQPFKGAKAVFWTNNPVGNALYRLIDHLVEIGRLERIEDDRVRWASDYNGKDFCAKSLALFDKKD